MFREERTITIVPNKHSSVLKPIVSMPFARFPNDNSQFRRQRSNAAEEIGPDKKKDGKHDGRPRIEKVTLKDESLD